MNTKIQRITENTIIVGIDIAKRIHWARITDSRGIDLCKALRIDNNIEGFTSFISHIIKLKQKFNVCNIIVGMEPSGHYWKALGWFLKNNDIRLVGVNPYHVKQLKELDDNSQTKNDKKDAYVIACLIRDGRHFEMYLPENEYGALRSLQTHRDQLTEKKKRAMSLLLSILDEYFPEYETVLPFSVYCTTSLKILQLCSFPCDFISHSEASLYKLLKDNGLGRRLSHNMVKDLINASKLSIGVSVGLSYIRIRILDIIDEIVLYQKQIKKCDTAMDIIMESLDLSQYLTDIPGVGKVIAAAFIAETGDLERFDDWKQIQSLAGLNLTEQSSGQHKGKTKISKRGRPGLRRVIYLLGDKGMLVNPEMRQYYYYLRKRPNNQLKHTQAILAVGIKMMRIIFTIAKTKVPYDPYKALGPVRIQQIASVL